jgi:hypothetical protein
MRNHQQDQGEFAVAKGSKNSQKSTCGALGNSSSIHLCSWVSSKVHLRRQEVAGNNSYGETGCLSIRPNHRVFDEATYVAKPNCEP